MPDRDSDLDSLVRRIEIRANTHLEQLGTPPGRVPIQAEQDLLALLDRQAAELVGRFDALGVFERPAVSHSRSVGELVLGGLHGRSDSAPDRPAKIRALVCGFLAAEIERHGKYRLYWPQRVAMAAHYEALGAGFTEVGLHRHAMVAYKSAADLYLGLKQNGNRDRCLHEIAKARHRTRPIGTTWAAEAAASALCGYGYAPFRLLGWMAAQIAAVGVMVFLLSKDSLLLALHSSLINFLNPLGLGDVQGLPPAASAALIAESYTGYLSTTVFFALLVRRWFQT